MKRSLALIALLMFVFVCSGCVSEMVNKSIGNMLNDPDALETPKDPDEPIFDPQSNRLIEHSETNDIQGRFENVQ